MGARIVGIGAAFAVLAIIVGCSMPEPFPAEPFVDDPIFSLELDGTQGEMFIFDGNLEDGPRASDAQLIQKWRASRPYYQTMLGATRAFVTTGVHVRGLLCNDEWAVLGVKEVHGGVMASVYISLDRTTGEGRVKMSVGHDANPVDVYEITPYDAPLINASCPTELVQAAGCIRLLKLCVGHPLGTDES